MKKCMYMSKKYYKGFEGSYLKWINEKLKCIWWARKIYMEATAIESHKYDKDTIMYLYNLTEWEYSELVQKRFNDIYSISEIADYCYMSVHRIIANLEEGQKYIFFKYGRNDIVRITNHLKLKYSNKLNNDTELSLWRMSENDTHLWNICPNLEIRLLKEKVKFFEKKYGGTFWDTLNLNKDISKSEWEDAVEWDFLLYTLEKDFNADINLIE
ncbi:hypothetical protein [Clostridium sp. UBA1353]|uniref:hypothetical protein n=1 Tax=Clostridium sp. UBA1353 TaxID=1946347 RepID=UPI00321732D0